MYIAIACAAVAGAALGPRFRVYVLVPVTVVVIAAVAGFGLAHGTHGATIVFLAVAAAAALQVGYLAGLALCIYTRRQGELHAREH